MSANRIGWRRRLGSGRGGSTRVMTVLARLRRRGVEGRRAQRTRSLHWEAHSLRETQAKMKREMDRKQIYLRIVAEVAFRELRRGKRLKMRRSKMWCLIMLKSTTSIRIRLKHPVQLSMILTSSYKIQIIIVTFNMQYCKKYRRINQLWALLISKKSKLSLQMTIKARWEVLQITKRVAVAASTNKVTASSNKVTASFEKAAPSKRLLDSVTSVAWTRHHIRLQFRNTRG